MRNASKPFVIRASEYPCQYNLPSLKLAFTNTSEISILFSTLSENYFIKDPYINVSTAIFATIILIIFGAIAGYIPAKRASKIKPIVALRDE